MYPLKLRTKIDIRKEWLIQHVQNTVQYGKVHKFQFYRLACN